MADCPGPACDGRPDTGPGFRADVFLPQVARNGGRAPTIGEPLGQGRRSRGVPVLALQNVSRQSGMVAVEAAGDQQIDCEPENLRDLDPADVLKPRAYVPSQRIVAAYQYQRLPYRLTISATRHTSESVLTAICESAEIISVAGQQGRMRHQARFWLRSLNLQHVPVTLPDNADLWSVTAGRPARGSAPETRHLPRPLAGWTSRLRQRAPRPDTALRNG